MGFQFFKIKIFVFFLLLTLLCFYREYNLFLYALYLVIHIFLPDRKRTFS